MGETAKNGSTPPKNGDGHASEGYRRDENRRGEDRRAGSGRRQVDVLSPQDCAGVLHRILARLIDTLLFWALFISIPLVGVPAAFLYVLIADGLMGGRSVGKRIIGIRVVCMDNGEPAGFRESILRNLTVALVLLFASIPILGWILFVIFGLAVIALEIFLLCRDAHGQRVGDILAQTLVIFSDDIPASQRKPLGSCGRSDEQTDEPND